MHHMKPKLQIDYKIPCIVIESPTNKKDMIIYFHSNSEDIHACYALCKQISDFLDKSMILVEFAGYGYHVEKKSSEFAIKSDALHVYDFLVKVLQMNPGRQI